MSNRQSDTPRKRGELFAKSRRRVLLGIGSGLAGVLAGCSQGDGEPDLIDTDDPTATGTVTDENAGPTTKPDSLVEPPSCDQENPPARCDAEPSGFAWAPASVIEELELVESGPGVIDSQTAGRVNQYRRAPGRDDSTLIGGFIDTHGTPGAGASVVSPPDVGIINGIFADGPWAGLDIAAEDVSLVVPVGAGVDGEITPDEVIALVPSAAVGGVQWVGGAQWAGGADWDGRVQWVDGTQWRPSEPWVQGARGMAGGSPDRNVLLMVRSDAPATRFGRDAFPGESLGPESDVDLSDAILATPLDSFDSVAGSSWDRRAVFEAGQPAKLGGRTFGVSVWSAPTGVGSPARWIVDGEVADLEGQRIFLETDLGRQMIADTVGPVSPEDGEALTRLESAEGDGDASVMILEQETVVRSFVGALDRDGTPLGVGIHIAGVEFAETNVAVVGTHHWPIGSVDVDLSMPFEFGKKARNLLGEFLAQIEYREREDSERETETAAESEPCPVPSGERDGSLCEQLEANMEAGLVPYDAAGEPTLFTLSYPCGWGTRSGMFELREHPQEDHQEVSAQFGISASIDGTDHTVYLLVRQQVPPAPPDELEKEAYENYETLTYDFGGESRTAKVSIPDWGTLAHTLVPYEHDDGSKTQHLVNIDATPKPAGDCSYGVVNELTKRVIRSFEPNSDTTFSPTT